MEGMSRARRGTSVNISYNENESFSNDEMEESSFSDKAEENAAITKSIATRAKRNRRISEGKVADSDNEEELEFDYMDMSSQKTVHVQDGSEVDDENESKTDSSSSVGDDVRHAKEQKEATRRQPSRSSRTTRNLSEVELLEDSILAGELLFTKPRKQKPKEKTQSSIQVHKIREASPRKKQNISLHISANTTTSSSEEEDFEDSGEEEEEIRAERIIASKSLRKSDWINVCKNKRTSEIVNGSRFLSDVIAPLSDEDDNFEERFLIKWHDLSYVHCSWETETDLMNQNDNFSTLKRSFFKKSRGGYLYSLDERGDGEYFDPNYCEIDRLLEVVEDDDTEELILDEKHPNFQSGRGRQLLVKWCNLGYATSSYEYERDLIWNDIDYSNHIKVLKERLEKPDKSSIQRDEKVGDKERRKLYKIFGDAMESNESDELKAKFMKDLQDVKFKNGGSVRDYQAEGIAWMLSSYINQRGGILADEMGLGKTLQTVSFINYLRNTLHKRGPFLIIAPLSTIPHWQREFVNWTDLNTIVYHGTAEDREYAREFEFAYEEDRPDKVASNRSFLKACHPRKYKTWQKIWSIDVVITTPEMLIAEDYLELTNVSWEVLVVDEAHRMKNSKSKLASNLLSDRFSFKHKLLLTGTPIQNNMAELWCLMNVIDPDTFSDQGEFLEKYGDMKDKDSIDALHELIRPYILRRLKEDVEKSVPPKEETIIEVELTSIQKQYYRALYEKNVGFLNRNDKKPLDGPNLMNLAMELRKCCNHTFLIKGAEEDLRKAELSALSDVSDFNEAEFLVKASGKLVLLDKLLPHLKSNGHRVLMFSQFKIMLDIIEDYLDLRGFRFERIDGSITGLKRQRAIDRYQAPLINPSGDHSKAPFIMLISTKAGGVGINLTAADTCIIFDSDWNPQADLQAQARCHRIGQTKSVQVYRLISRKTYEMQMFHMASLKMGLDQAVLQGIENNGGTSSGEGGLSKEEVEKLLRHGAYEIFTEGNDNASSEFADASIESILESNARRIIHENTGSESKSKGGTFSKASFKVEDKHGGDGKSEVDIDDPDFWKKMVGEAKPTKQDTPAKSRKRRKVNYNMNASPGDSSNGDDNYADANGSSSSDDEDETSTINSEKKSWGGKRPVDWKRSEAISMLDFLHKFGYCSLTAAEDDKNKIGNSFKPTKTRSEVQRFSWSLVFYSLILIANDKVEKEKLLLMKGKNSSLETVSSTKTSLPGIELIGKYFHELVTTNKSFLKKVIDDANSFARTHQARSDGEIDTLIHGKSDKKSETTWTAQDVAFMSNLWPQLVNRGWTMNIQSGQRVYLFGKDLTFYSTLSVMNSITNIHPELKPITDHIIQSFPAPNPNETSSSSLMTIGEIPRYDDLVKFLHKYAPLQLIRGKNNLIPVSGAKRVLDVALLMFSLRNMIKIANEMKEDDIESSLNSIVAPFLNISAKPHNDWNTRADCTLLVAMSKHGWIDNKGSYKSILQDKSLSWGSPFESDIIIKGPSSNHEESFEHFVKGKIEAAKRLISFLNETCATSKIISIPALKHFQFDVLSKVYGLRAKSQSNGDTSSNLYELDSAALRASSEEEFKQIGDAEALPSRLALVKRAKQLLSTFIESEQKLGNHRGAHTSAVKFSFLNCKKEPTDYFLFYLLVNATKVLSSETLLFRSILDIAKVEAEERFKFSNKKIYDEIANHIAFANSKLSKYGLRLSKNVIRAIVKLEPVSTTKGAHTSLFPPDDKEHAKTLIFADQLKHKVGKPPRSLSPDKKKRRREVKNSIAESIIAKSMATFKAKRDKSKEHSSSSAVLAISPLEALLLSVMVSQGFPVFTENWKSLVDTSVPSTDENELRDYVISFHGMAHVLAFAAKEWCKLSQVKLANAQCKVNEMERNPVESAKAMKTLLNCEKDFAAKKDLLVEIDNAVKDIRKITVRSIGLVEEMRRHMGSIETSHRAPNILDENGLGKKVLTWFQYDLQRWTGALDCKETVSNSEMRPPRSTVAELDRDDCRAIFAQIAQQSRLRSIILRNGIFRLNKLTVKAVKNSEQLASDNWELRPSWWKSVDVGSGDDSCLLTTILTCGYSGFDPKVVYHGRADDLTSLTKAALQPRIYHLTRELSALQDVEEGHINSVGLKSIENNSSGEKRKNQMSQASLGVFFQTQSRTDTNESSSNKVIDLINVDSLDDATPTKKAKVQS